MTKQEAIKEMQNNKIKLSDGSLCNPKDFWLGRKNKKWDYGYFVFSN